MSDTTFNKNEVDELVKQLANDDEFLASFADEGRLASEIKDTLGKSLTKTKSIIKVIYNWAEKGDPKFVKLYSDIQVLISKRAELNLENDILNKRVLLAVERVELALVSALSKFGYKSFVHLHLYKDRFKVNIILLEGGRFSAKTHSAVLYLLYRALNRQPIVSQDDLIKQGLNASEIEKYNRNRGGQIFAGRTMETAVKTSVWKAVTEKIKSLGLSDSFRIVESRLEIVCIHNDVTITFTGYNKLVQGGRGAEEESMKGLENAFLIWVDEAQTIEQNILQKLQDTIIRNDESILLLTMNRKLADDDAYVFATEQHSENSHVQHFFYEDNVYLNKESRDMAETAKRKSYSTWLHEYAGMPKSHEEDSFWKPDTISKMYSNHYYDDIKDELTSIIIGIDPAGGGKVNPNEWGIVVVGKVFIPSTKFTKKYILEDASGIFSGGASADIGAFNTIIGLCQKYNCYDIAYEGNGVGSQMLDFENHIQTQKRLGNLPPNFAVRKKTVWAAVAKETRHAPAASMSERGELQFVAGMDFLRMQQQMMLCTSRGYLLKKSGASPDRVDALQIAVTNLDDLENQGDFQRVFSISIFGDLPVDPYLFYGPIKDKKIIALGSDGLLTAIVVGTLYQHKVNGDFKCFVEDYDIFENTKMQDKIEFYKNLYPKSCIFLEDGNVSSGVAKRLSTIYSDDDFDSYGFDDLYTSKQLHEKVTMVMPFINDGFFCFGSDLKYITHNFIHDNWFSRSFLAYSLDCKQNKPIIKCIANIIQSLYNLDG